MQADLELTNSQVAALQQLIISLGNKVFLGPVYMPRDLSYYRNIIY
jgi:hypothetical protein